MLLQQQLYYFIKAGERCNMQHRQFYCMSDKLVFECCISSLTFRTSHR